MSLAKRIIPCLDVCNGAVVKGVNFVGLQNAGNPVEIAKRYNDEGADEIVLLDITASYEQRGTMIEIVKNIAREIFIPFSVGGGIRSLEDMSALLNAGCDKISINSAAIKNPQLIDEGAKRFGSQCTVVAIDAKMIAPHLWHIYINGGRGEILLTSMDTDGTKNGYDKAMIESLASCVNVPIIASGGAGKMEDFANAFIYGADAALAASVFHYGEIEINALKHYLQQKGISVRI